MKKKTKIKKRKVSEITKGLEAIKEAAEKKKKQLHEKAEKEETARKESQRREQEQRQRETVSRNDQEGLQAELNMKNAVLKNNPRSNGRTGDKVLTFDPNTGELMVGKNPNDDSIVVDSIYKDGFFYKDAA